MRQSPIERLKPRHANALGSYAWKAQLTNASISSNTRGMTVIEQKEQELDELRTAYRTAQSDAMRNFITTQGQALKVDIALLKQKEVVRRRTREQSSLISGSE